MVERRGCRRILDRVLNAMTKTPTGKIYFLFISDRRSLTEYVSCLVHFHLLGVTFSLLKLHGLHSSKAMPPGEVKLA